MIVSMCDYNVRINEVHDCERCVAAWELVSRIVDQNVPLEGDVYKDQAKGFFVGLDPSGCVQQDYPWEIRYGEDHVGSERHDWELALEGVGR